jgi:hypothetical protein
MRSAARHALIMSCCLILFGCEGDEATGIAGICDVTNPVVRLTVSPANDTIFFRVPIRSADMLQLTVSAFGRADNLRTDVPFRFSSSDTLVMTVDGAGVVRPRSAGSAVITATSCDERARATITGMTAVAQVILNPLTLTLVEDDTALVTARVTDQGGQPMPDVQATFQLSNPVVAGLVQRSDTTAMVRALQSGPVSVSASVEGSQSGATSVTVLSKAILTLDAGSDFVCSTIALGRGYCWGRGDVGQLGTPGDSLCFEEGAPPPGRIPCAIAPLRFGPDLAFASVSAGGDVACGITTSSGVYCWGSDALGQLGNGGVGGPGPVPATVFSNLPFASVSAGGQHVCGIAVGGDAYCWGRDLEGQLGDGRRINSTTPIPVVGVQGFTSISAGGSHTCGVRNDGSGFCWGNNTSGELGDGTLITKDRPSPIVGNLRFSVVSAGGGFSCGIDVAGALHCWGGGLGLGMSPTLLAAGPFTALSSGGSHACVISTGGSASCIGNDGDEQLGNGAGGSSSSLVAVVGGLTFTRISAGQRHSCGLATDGFGYCWGSNVFGALGNELQAAFRGVPNRIARVR